MKQDFHFPLELKSFKRKMAVILPKDAGAIIAHANIHKGSSVVEIGGGNGFLTFYLSRVAKEVVTYEKREDAFSILKHNVQSAGLDNVKLKNEDGLEFTETGVDAVIADIPNASSLVERAHDALKEGGFFVAYQPNVEQVKETTLKAEDVFEEVFALSNISYDLVVRERGVRPANNCLFHTAYLVFARKGR